MKTQQNSTLDICILRSYLWNIKETVCFRTVFVLLISFVGEVKWRTKIKCSLEWNNSCHKLLLNAWSLSHNKTRYMPWRWKILWKNNLVIVWVVYRWFKGVNCAYLVDWWLLILHPLHNLLLEDLYPIVEEDLQWSPS